MVEPRRVYRWLTGQGVPGELALRALRLAQRATVVRLGAGEAVVAVPSQRLHVQHPVHAVTHLDLAALLRGEQPRPVTATVGELPEDQQVYMVRVTSKGASCQCPLTRLAGAPLCVHRVAAAVLLYERGRPDLLAWLPAAARAYREWLREWRRARSRVRGGRGRPLLPVEGYN